MLESFGKTDSLRAVGGSITAVDKSDNNYVVNIAQGDNSCTVTLKSAGAFDFKQNGNVLGVVNYIGNNVGAVSISGTAGCDSITTSGEGVTVNPGSGIDTITGSDDGEVFLFGAQSGSNLITNFGVNDTLAITSGSISTSKSGNDLIASIKLLNRTATVTLAGAGAYRFIQSDGMLTTDGIYYITNSANDVTIAGSSGADSIKNTGSAVTIAGGAGNDTINRAAVYQYSAGDDVLTAYTAGDTIQIVDATVGSSIDGNDVIFIADNGSIRLKNASKKRITTRDSEGNIVSKYYTAQSIRNTLDGTLIELTEYGDSIRSSGEGVSIRSGMGNDTITGSSNGEMLLFDYLSGNNVMTNFGLNDTLVATSGSIKSVKKSGDDYVVSIKKSSNTATVTLAGTEHYKFVRNGSVLTTDGIYYINNTDSDVTVKGTSGNDSIKSNGANVTIAAGKGDDTITGSSNAEVFAFGYTSGNDVITNFGMNDTLRATSGSIKSVKKSGNDYVISIGKNSTIATVTLQGTGNYKFVKNGSVLTTDGINYINNSVDGVSVSGTGGADSIKSSGKSVTISTGKGDDTITGSSNGEMMLFGYASGNNVVTNFGMNDTLKATNGSIKSVKKSGNDYVISIGKNSTIATVTLRGTGNYKFVKNGNVLTTDGIYYITNSASNVTVSGTSGADSIKSSGAGISIVAGKGDDTLTGSKYGDVFSFAYNHGNNVITNFGANDTLKITSGSIKSYAASGKDYIVEVTKNSVTGTVTLKNTTKSYTLKKSGSTITATAKSSSAELPSSAEDYWFEQDSANEAPLGEIMSEDAAIDFNFYQLKEIFKPTSAFELANSARKQSKK